MKERLVWRGMTVSQKIGWNTGPRTATGCREWLGFFVGLKRHQYAGLTVNGRAERVTRLILGLGHGDPRQALHSCDNTHCVEPSHLRPGTASDNMKDKVKRGRFVRPIPPPAATHCRFGHPRTKLGNGDFYCRTCHTAREREKREARRVSA